MIKPFLLIMTILIATGPALIPGIKINTDAMARTAQLVQEGFVKISES